MKKDESFCGVPFKKHYLGDVTHPDSKKQAYIGAFLITQLPWEQKFDLLKKWHKELRRRLGSWYCFTHPYPWWQAHCDFKAVIHALLQEEWEALPNMPNWYFVWEKCVYQALNSFNVIYRKGEGESMKWRHAS